MARVLVVVVENGDVGCSSTVVVVEVVVKVVWRCMVVNV